MNEESPKRTLSFSIDSILSKDIEKTPNAEPKYSPYADDRLMTSHPCFGTEALDARLAQNSFSGESDEDCDADDNANFTTSRNDVTDKSTSSPEDSEKQSSLMLKCKSKKKTRTVFSRQQVFYLEAAFDAKRYLSSAERSEIATSLNLSETQVKVWFQNRRNKWKAQLNGDDKGTSAPDHGPIFLPPFLCNSVAAAVSAHAQRGHQSGMTSFPVFRQPVFY